MKRDTASFFVVADGLGTPLTFQWYFGTKTITGATNDTLVVSNVTSNNAGQYYVAVRNAGGTLNSTKATLTVIYNPPVATNDAYTTPENVALAVGAPGVLANDTDPNGDAMTVQLVSGVSHGTLSLSTNGGFTYTPALYFSGTDSFTYQARDSDGLVGSNATVTLTVTFVDQAPVAANQSLTLPANLPANLRLTATDVDGQSLTYSIVSGPTNGVLSALNSTTGVVTYTPRTNFVGNDSFTFAASDGTLAGTARVTLTVLAPPAISGQPQGQALWVGQNCSLSLNATGSAPLSYQWQFNGANLPGATTSSLVLTNVQLAAAGSYTVVVTNLVGSVTSAAANLLVANPTYQLLPAWTAPFSGSANNPATAVGTAVDAQGNIYLTGYTKGPNGVNDYVTLKCDANSNLLWQAWYDNGSGHNSQPAALAVDSAGNVYVTGASQGDGTGWDYATVKYDSNGNQLWAARFNGPANKDDQACGLALAANGNVVVTGSSKYSSDHKVYATVQYDGAGNQLWVNTYVGPGVTEDDANSVAVDANGNVYVTGQSRGSGSDFDFATIKYSAAGAQLWAARYNGPANKADAAVQVVVDAAANVYVTGTSVGANGHPGYATLKYDSSGNQLWLGRYDSAAGKDNTAAALAVDGVGNVFVTGAAGSTNGTGADFGTVKYSPSGQLLWLQLSSNGQDDQAVALALDPAGDVYVTGKSQASGTGYDILTLKYRSLDGLPMATARFNSSGNLNDAPVGLAVDNQFNVFVAGQGFNPLDYILLKYQPSFLAPTVCSLGATNIALTSAVLNATVNAQGGPTTCYFCYGITTNYGSSTPLLSGLSPTVNPVSASLSGLTDGTVYHYCLVASNAAGVTVSQDATFTTSVGAPSGSTLSATSITANGATLNAQVTQQLLALSSYFQYGETTNYGSVSATTLIPALGGVLGGGGLLGVATPISGLTPGHIYHYRLVLSGLLGTTYGQDASFVTPSLPPVQLGGRVSSSGLGSTGKMRVGLTSTPGTSFTVLSSTNMVTWTVVGTMTEVAPGQYAFTDPQPATNRACWYRIRSP